MKKSFSFLIILICIFLHQNIFSLSYAPVDSFRYEGTLKCGESRVPGMIMNVYLDNKKILSKTSNKQGNFFFYFLHNKQYTIELIKKDYIIQKIVIDTKASDATDMAIDNTIPVFEYFDGLKTELFDSPVLYYVYNENSGFFEQDRKRSKSQISGITSKVISIRNKLATEALKKADAFVKKKQYEDALVEYRKVLDYMPSNVQVPEKIKEVEKILKNNPVQLEADYKGSIELADKSLSDKKYKDAVTNYKKASALKPEKLYPQNQVYYIDSLLSHMYSANKPAYDKQKQSGDLNFKNKNYEQAQKEYESALSYMPDEPIVSKQLKNTISIIEAEKKKKEEEQKAIEEKVNNLLKRASDYSDKKDYANAIAMYNQALQLKPDDSGITEMKDKAAKLLAELAALKLRLQKEKSYNDTIALADSVFKIDQYDIAINFYKVALNIFPEENYPAKRIKEAEKRKKNTENIEAIEKDSVKGPGAEKQQVVTSELGRLLDIAKNNQTGNDLKSALGNLQKALLISQKNGDKNAQVEILSHIASVYYDSGLYKLSIKNLELALEIRKEMKDKPGMAVVYNELGTTLAFLYEFERALEAYQNALEIYKTLGNTLAKAEIKGKIADIYYQQHDLKKSVEFNRLAITDAKAVGNVELTGNLINNLGVVLYAMGKYDDAVKCYSEAISIDEQSGNERNLSLAYNNLGNVNFDWKQFKTAISFYEKSIKIKRKLNFEEGIALSLMNMGNAYLELNKLKQAEELLQSALSLATKVKFNDVVKQAYQSLAVLYEKQQSTKKALDAYKALSDRGGSVSVGQMPESENMYSVESKTIRQLKKELIRQKLLTQNEMLLNQQKSQQLSLQESQLSEQRAKNTRNKVLIFCSLALAIFAGFIAFQFFKRYEEKKRYSQIIEFQKRQITDSIEYASRIQKAVLPDEAMVKTLFPESFVLNKPKDIVSGDFFFIAPVQDKVYVAVADCTGHGVPGAFMSMLGFTLSKEVIQLSPSELNAAQVLNLLRDVLMKSLHQTGRDEEAKDGMDFALCIIDKNGQTLEFAGANNPCFVVRNKELIELKPDKMPIGIHPVLDSFHSQKFELKKHDHIYMFSDGFRDQISGNTLKKFKKDQFVKVLVDINDLDMNNQLSALERCHTDWKGDMEQTDDIMILGIKI